MKNYLKKSYFAIHQVFVASPFISLFSIVAVTIAGISPVISNIFTAKIVDFFDSGNFVVENTSALIFSISFITGSSVINFFSSNIKGALSDILGCKLSNNIENIISNKSQKIPQHIMDKPYFLDLYKNTVEKVGYEPINILDSLLNIISSFVGLVSYFLILFSFNLLAPIILLITLIPVYFLRKNVHTKGHNCFKTTTMLIRQIWYFFSLTSDKKYASEVRVFKLFPFLKTEKNKLFSIYIKKRKSVLVYSIFFIFLASIFALFGPLFIELWMVRSLIDNTLSLSNFVLFNSAVISLSFGLISVSDQFISSKRSLQFLDFLFEFLNLEEIKLHKKSNNNKKIETVETIEFVNVWFKYPDSPEYCLKDINLKFKKGQKLCLIGKNGSGKSTLIKLLLKIYEPSSGKILINGIDANNCNANEYYKFFSIIFQDCTKYSLNVQNCIGFGNIDEVKNLLGIKETAKQTGAHDFIKKYKDKYKTNLSREFYDEAVEPSGGQWQRLAIARSFFSKAQILIMDEPTSALDPEAEEKIFNVIESYSKNNIVLLISHIMSSAKMSDRIILLSDGKILEEGTHQELTNQKGLYYKMYNLQATKYL